MLIEGVWAEIIVGGEHLRLFSEHNAMGCKRRSTTSARKVGLHLQSLLMTLNKEKNERQSTRGPTLNALQMRNCLH